MTVFRVRDAGAAPQTAADRAAWKRVVSPKRWRVLSNGDHISRSATPSLGRAAIDTGDEAVRRGDGQAVRQEAAGSLPARPSDHRAAGARRA